MTVTMMIMQNRRREQMENKQTLDKIDKLIDEVIELTDAFDGLDLAAVKAEELREFIHDNVDIEDDL